MLIPALAGEPSARPRAPPGEWGTGQSCSSSSIMVSMGPTFRHRGTGRSRAPPAAGDGAVHVHHAPFDAAGTPSPPNPCPWVALPRRSRLVVSFSSAAPDCRPPLGRPGLSHVPCPGQGGRCGPPVWYAPTNLSRVPLPRKVRRPAIDPPCIPLSPGQSALCRRAQSIPSSRA